MNRCLLLALACVGVLSVGCAPDYHPMKALMIVGGGYHDYKSLPVALADRLTRRGDVVVDINEDVLSLDAKAIEPYRVLIFNDCQRPQLSDAFKKALLSYVQSGHGLVIVHCSLWSYYDWPEWTKLIGGHAESHDKFGPYEVVVLDPAHATMLGIGNRFTITDEAYRVEERDPSATVLIETAVAHPDANGQLRAGPDPQAWVKRYGQGRIFVTTFGHDAASQESDEFMDLLHNGIRWAGGVVPDTVHNRLTEAELHAGCKLLFDGGDLAGWKGDTALWTVENGELVGRANGLDRDSFLVHEGAWGDFTLRFSFRLIQGNSGVQVRSSVELADAPRPMKGPQVELVATKWGSVFNYGGGDKNEVGGLTGEAARVIVPNGWNEAVVQAAGRDVTVTINGVTTAQFQQEEAAARTGLIALQLHRGEPNEIRFRDIRIRPLSVSSN